MSRSFCVSEHETTVCRTSTLNIDGAFYFDVILPTHRYCAGISDGTGVYNLAIVALGEFEIERDVPCRYTILDESFNTSCVEQDGLDIGWSVHDEEIDGRFECDGRYCGAGSCTLTNAIDDYCAYLYGHPLYEESEFMRLTYAADCPLDEDVGLMAGVWCGDFYNVGTFISTDEFVFTVSPLNQTHLFFSTSNFTDQYFEVHGNHIGRGQELDVSYPVVYNASQNSFTASFFTNLEQPGTPTFFGPGVSTRDTKRGVCEYIESRELFIGSWYMKKISDTGTVVVQGNKSFIEGDNTHQFVFENGGVLQIIGEYSIVYYNPGEMNFFGRFEINQTNFRIIYNKLGDINVIPDGSLPSDVFEWIGSKIPTEMTTSPEELIEHLDRTTAMIESTSSTVYVEDSTTALIPQESIEHLDRTTAMIESTSSTVYIVICSVNNNYCGDSITIDIDSDLEDISIDGITLTIDSSSISFQNLAIKNSKIVLKGSSTVKINGCLTTENATLELILEDPKSEEEIVLIEYECFEEFSSYTIKNPNPNCENELDYRESKLVLIFKNCKDQFPIWAIILIAAIIAVITIFLIIILTVPSIRKVIFPYRDRTSQPKKESDRQTILTKLEELNTETQQLHQSIKHVKDQMDNIDES